MSRLAEIRDMDAEELAALCAAPCPPDQACGRNIVAPVPACRACWLRWLESETAKEGMT